MYFNFQQNRVKTQVIMIIDSQKLRKLAITNNNFEKNDYFRYASSYNVHVCQFSEKSG